MSNDQTLRSPYPCYRSGHGIKHDKRSGTLTWGRGLPGIVLIVIVILSTYFGAVAAAPRPSAIGPSLTLYQLSSSGQMVASTLNVFEAGQMIWVGVSNDSSPPYMLTVTSLSGLSVWSQQNSSLPAKGLMPVSLTP